MLDPAAYAHVYGPTAGDRVRLGDTSLVVRVEADDTRRGDEVVAGFGKTARDGLAGARGPGDTVDAVIVNVLVLDPLLGVRKTNIGIREGRMAARSGAPATPTPWTASRSWSAPARRSSPARA